MVCYNKQEYARGYDESRRNRMKESDEGIIRLKTVDSTNAFLNRLGREGAPEGTVCVADEQTAGRGRMDRIWHSPAGQGLWMSILLRPSVTMKDAGLLSFCAALAVSDALGSVSNIDAGIKWPNDLVCNGKKICGILSSCSLMPDGTYHAVVGMGINLKKNAYPEELNDRATSAEEENGRMPDTEALIHSCRERIMHYKHFLETGRKGQLIDKITERCVTLRKMVIVSGNGRKEIMGIAESIGPDGELIVACEDGHYEKIICGDVSVRGVMGYV